MNCRCVLIPLPLPAWTSHRARLNPPAHILFAWARSRGIDTRKGGGALRRAWRRHAYQEPVAVVRPDLGPLLRTGMVSYARAASEATQAVQALGTALVGLGEAFAGMVVSSSGKVTPAELEATFADLRDLALAPGVVG